MKKKTILISVVSTIITLVLVAFVIFPLFKGIKKTSQDLIAVKKELALIQNRTENVEQIEEIYQALETDLEKIDRLLIDPETPIELIKFWEKLVMDSGSSISISPFSIKTPEIDPWNSIGFRITLIGSFSNFLKFLEKIENSPYLIEIRNLVTKRLSEQELKLERYEQFSLDDVSSTLVIKVYTK